MTPTYLSKTIGQTENATMMLITLYSNTKVKYAFVVMGSLFEFSLLGILSFGKCTVEFVDCFSLSIEAEALLG